MKANGKILCFGEILWDCLPNGRMPGGAPMNVALHLNRFGINSLLASSVGDDKLGAELKEFLTKSGLATHLVQTNLHLPTSEVKVTLDKENNATFKICEPVAWDEISLNNELLDAIHNSKAIVYGSLVARNLHTRKTLLALLENDLTKIMDVNLRPPYDNENIVKELLSKSNIVKLNDDELIKVTTWYNMKGTLEVRMRALQEIFHFDILIVTRGKDGACLIQNDDFYEHKGFSVKTVDTVGSGDSFLAGFLAAIIEGKDMNSALKEACAIGAFVATQSGATPEYDKNIMMSIIEKDVFETKT
jgi:fructokinase